MAWARISSGVMVFLVVLLDNGLIVGLKSDLQWIEIVVGYSGRGGGYKLTATLVG